MSYRTLCILFFALTLITCTKPDHHCAGFDMAYQSWMPYSKNQTIRFRNAANEEISFVIDSKLLTMPEDVKSSADCPPQEYYVSGSSSTSRGRYHTLNISIGIFPPYDLNYQVLDCPGAFGISTTEMIPDTHLRPTGRVLDSVTLGGVTYTNVYTEEADTLGTIYVQPSSVWKTYYNKQYGVLGFEDRQTRSLFYRE